MRDYTKICLFQAASTISSILVLCLLVFVNDEIFPIWIVVFIPILSVISKMCASAGGYLRGWMDAERTYEKEDKDA